MSPWANWLSHRPFTAVIAGSNPAGDTKLKNMKKVFQIGDHVTIDFQNSKKLTGCTIAASYKESINSEILYDVFIPIGFDEETITLRGLRSELIREYNIEKDFNGPKSDVIMGGIS